MFFWLSKRINVINFVIFSSILFFLLHEQSLFRYVFLSYLLLFIGVYFNNKINVPSFLLYLGDISYSTYLNHQTICTILIGILISKIGYSDEKMIFIFLVMLVLIFAISAFSYKFIEKPCQVLARRLLCRLKK